MAKIEVNIQSSIMLSGTKTLYFDPWKLGENAPKADVVFVTHDHFDHYSPQDIKNIMTENTVIVAPEKMISDVIEKTGVSKEKCIAAVPMEKYEANGIEFETVPAYNKLKPFHKKSDGWCGYIAQLDGKSYYVMGDTDATEEAKRVSCDVLLIPVGGTYTMNVNKAAEFTCTVKPETAVPTHYGDVVGSPEDGESFKKLVEAKCPEINVEIKL